MVDFPGLRLGQLTALRWDASPAAEVSFAPPPSIGQRREEGQTATARDVGAVPLVADRSGEVAAVEEIADGVEVQIGGDLKPLGGCQDRPRSA